MRLTPASIEGSGLPASKKSSGDVVVVCRTAVTGSAALATSANRSSWQIIARQPELLRILPSSRSRRRSSTSTVLSPPEAARASANVSRARRYGDAHDVAIVGFDDISTAVLGHRPLTTLRINKKELGAVGVELLLNGRTEEVVEKVSPVELVVRASTVCGTIGTAG